MIDLADSNAVYYYHFDGLGSVVALTDANGTTVQSYEYSVYGHVAASDPNHPNPFMFTGREFDIETGLYYYRARYYNPYVGRFLQTDPVGYGYAYCGNNPVRCVDPSGLDSYILSYGGGLDDGGKIGFARWSDAGGLINLWWFYPDPNRGDPNRGRDAFQVWLDWVMHNEEGTFTDDWMAEQAGYQLATYDKDGKEYFDECLFWHVQALMYMGAFKTSEIALLDSKDIKFVDGKNNYFTPGELSVTAPHPESFGPSILAHELGHAIAYYELLSNVVRFSHLLCGEKPIGNRFN
jgi:RHS repeat-associated protein